jgi:hypothetical protein
MFFFHAVGQSEPAVPGFAVLSRPGFSKGHRGRADYLKHLKSELMVRSRIALNSAPGFPLRILIAFGQGVPDVAVTRSAWRN